MPLLSDDVVGVAAGDGVAVVAVARGLALSGAIAGATGPARPSCATTSGAAAPVRTWADQIVWAIK